MLSTPVRKRSAACASQTSQSHQMSTGSTLTFWPSYCFTCSLSSLSLPHTQQWPAGCGGTMPLGTQRPLSTQPRGRSAGGHWPCCSWWWGFSRSAGSRSTAMWSCCPATPSRPRTLSTSVSTGWLWAPLATTRLSTAAWIPPSVRSWGASWTCAGGGGGMPGLARSQRSTPGLLAVRATGLPGLTTAKGQGQGMLYPTRATHPRSRVTPLPTSLITARTRTCFSPLGRSSETDATSSQWSPSLPWVDLILTWSDQMVFDNLSLVLTSRMAWLFRLSNTRKKSHNIKDNYVIRMKSLCSWQLETGIREESFKTWKVTGGPPGCAQWLLTASPGWVKCREMTIM